MLLTLSLTCYQPNATFIYNPITHQGTLTASYLPPDDSSPFKLCAQLQNHLARAKVELANSEIAISSNFNFRHLEQLHLQISFDSVAQQNAGLVTRQSNFLVQIMDMDAEIRQTLSYFSLLVFNHDDCIASAVCEIHGSQIVIRAENRGCDLSNTQFAAGGGIDDESFNKTVIASLSLFDKLLDMPSGLLLRDQPDANRFEIIFDCVHQQDEIDAEICFDIIRSLALTPVLDFNIIFNYQMQRPDHSFLQINTKINQIFEVGYDNCFKNTTYQLNTQMVVFYLNPTGKCNFGDGRVQTIIGLTDSMNLQNAKIWTADIKIAELTSESTRYSVECKQLDDKFCKSSISVLEKIQNVFMFFRIVIHNTDGTVNFIIIEPSKYQECYTSTEMLLSFPKGAVEAKLILKSHAIAFQTCQLNVLTRQTISLFLYRHTVPDGSITQIEDTPFYEFSIIDQFSTANTSIQFSLTDLNVIREISSLVRQDMFYALIRYGTIRLPVFNTIDQADLYDQTPIYMIMIIGGLLGGIFIAGLEILIFMRKIKRLI
ncbi:hypothetical protein SS50377_22744 [Spironucleus salmonicida]|uniref:Uncharacterized protein n=1 Tax=Spironucleus salmonicida TaxID=348837 RepID=V6LYT8_9EUKA|nr:hypothetical protein SS50377_22744 [Spironucleus salmonicida]|eukprot:EST48896.1 hypothetical protein SS50377_10867 [Spironucleus salmonicida]